MYVSGSPPDSAEVDHVLSLQLLNISASKSSAFPVTSSCPSTPPTILWSCNHTSTGVCVCVHNSLDDITNHSPCRVERLAVASSLEVDLTSLRQSIQALQAASARLDTEKAEAEVKLRKILGNLKKRKGLRRKLCHKLRKGICKLAKYIGKKCKAPEDGELTDFVFAFDLI